MIKKNDKDKKRQENLQNNKAVLSETLISEEPAELSLAEKLREKKKQQKKILYRRLRRVGYVVVLSYIIYWGFKPFEGTVPYALCKVLLELNVPYPTTLHYTETSELRTGAVRIWFTYVDPFGVFRNDAFVCTFTQEPETNRTILAQARMGKIDIDQKQIDSFNLVLPYLVKGGYYDTTAPAPLARNVEDLQFETDMYRKIKLFDIMKTY